MVIAYAVALQVLLTSVLVSQNVGALVSADPARVDIICFGAGGDGGGDHDKTSHATRQDCCVLCNSTVSFAALTAIALLPRAAYGAAVISYIAPAEAAPATFHPTPRLSQGPPQNA